MREDEDEPAGEDEPLRAAVARVDEELHHRGQRKESLELGRVGHRCLAGEALAHVGGRAAVDRRAVPQQRYGAGDAAGEHDVGPEASRARRRQQLGDVLADQRDLLRRPEVEGDGLQQVAERLRVLLERASPAAAIAPSAASS